MLNDIDDDESYLAVRTIAMPSDTNPAGDVFGGWLLAQMDLAAGSIATKLAKGRCATVAIDSMQFLNPVHVGDEVSIYARIEKTGKTSITMQVEAWRRRRDQDDREKVTNADFTFVALNDYGQKRPVNEKLERH